MSGLYGGWGSTCHPYISKISYTAHEAWGRTRSDTSKFLLSFQGSVLQNRDHAACQYTRIVLYCSLAHNCRENQKDCIILLNTQAQCAELFKWPTYVPFCWDATACSLVDVYVVYTWWGQKSHFFFDDGICKLLRKGVAFHSNHIKSTSNLVKFLYLLPSECPNLTFLTAVWKSAAKITYSLASRQQLSIFASNHRIKSRYTMFTNT
jgi:hypothetical protein